MEQEGRDGCQHVAMGNEGAFCSSGSSTGIAEGVDILRDYFDCTAGVVELGSFRHQIFEVDEFEAHSFDFLGDFLAEFVETDNCLKGSSF